MASLIGEKSWLVGWRKGLVFGERFAEQAAFSAESDPIHFGFASERGGFSAKVSEEVAKGHGLEGVVNFAVGGTLAESLLEPIGEGILEGKIVKGWSFGGEAKGFWEVMGENNGATGNGEGVF